VTWTSVRVTSLAERRDAVGAALFEAGSQGLQEDGPSLVTHFPADADLDAVRAAVLHADADAEVVMAPVPPVDWTEAWKERIGAHSLGALTVAPPWLAGDYDPATTIVVDPGMAFGTGEHATTRGVVRLMQGVVRAGDVVADLGAGSAVLAIAAAKLGAARIAAVELDPEAIGNAEENVARNGVADRVSVMQGDAGVLLPLIAPVRLVLANIISSVLTDLLPAIAAALTADGQAILSGILQTERAEMLQVLDANGWRVDAEDAEDIWWSARISRR
jgi:ribosomal protein L11 methyltransferase